jgi:hypothetical protein
MSTPAFSNVLSLGMIRGEIFSCCQKGGGKEDKKDEYKIQVCTLQWHTQTGTHVYRKKVDDDQNTDSKLTTPTPSPHHQHSSPPTLVSLHFGCSVKRNEGRSRRRCTLHWFRAEESYTISETHKMRQSLHFRNKFRNRFRQHQNRYHPKVSQKKL